MMPSSRALMDLLANEGRKLIKPPVIEHRNCWCGLPAWYRSTYPDGSKEFQCPFGDITIVEPPREVK